MGRVIERVYIHNYKCLVNFELKLQETVLQLGANGVGKTAVLDVMFGLRKLLAGEAKITDRVAFHPTTLTRWQARREQVFVIQATIGGESFIYRLEIEHMDDGRRSRIVEESLVADGTNGPRRSLRGNAIPSGRVLASPGADRLSGPRLRDRHAPRGVHGHNRASAHPASV